MIENIKALFVCTQKYGKIEFNDLNHNQHKNT